MLLIAPAENTGIGGAGESSTGNGKIPWILLESQRTNPLELPPTG